MLRNITIIEAAKMSCHVLFLHPMTVTVVIIVSIGTRVTVSLVITAPTHLLSFEWDLRVPPAILMGQLLCFINFNY